MTRPLFYLIVSTALSAAPQQPSIQNGRVETRPATALARDVASLAAGSADPVWIGWRVPMVDGQRGNCSTYANDSDVVRGEFLENGPFSSSGTMRPPTGPVQAVQLEAASDLTILLRVTEGSVERLRPLRGDCPIDAGGRTVYWLQGVTPSDSITYLGTLMPPANGLTPAQEQRLGASALAAIALHRDPAADVVLDRLAMSPSDSALRRSARSSLASARGAHGFAILKQLFDAERMADTRRQLISVVGQTRQPGTVDLLLTTARHDGDPKVRAEAVYWLPQRGGVSMAPDVTAIIANDRSDTVKQRAVQGLARLPAEDATPLLLQLAKTNADPAVRKEAVTVLGRSMDPRAVAYMEELIK